VTAGTEQNPAIIVSFDDDYAARFTRELEKVCPTVHVSPLLRTLRSSVESLQPAIIVFDLQTIKTENHTIFEIMESLNEAFPRARKIGLGHQNMPSQIISAMKAGACDFLDRDATPQEIRDTIVWQLSQARSVRSDRAGQVIALVSGRENEGESEIASNLAAHFASKRAKGDVLLLDLTLEPSQLEIDFNVEVTYSVRDALDELVRLDKHALIQVLTKHSCGLCLLPLTTRNSRDDEISAQQLATLLSALRNFFGMIVINAGCLRDKYCQQYLLPLCDRVLVVCTQTLGSVRTARGIVPPRDANTEDDGKFGLIVSKYDPDIELLPDQIALRLGIPVTGMLPTSWVSLANSHNIGAPLVLSSPGHRYARALRDLAVRVSREGMDLNQKQTANTLFGLWGQLKRAVF
jgi:pilus assembly protein CpaE